MIRVYCLLLIAGFLVLCVSKRSDGETTIVLVRTTSALVIYNRNSKSALQD